jgi:hypothetical protein
VTILRTILAAALVTLRARFDQWDYLLFVGFSMFLIGVWWVAPPIALMLGGLAFAAASVIGSQAAARKRLQATTETEG